MQTSLEPPKLLLQAASQRAIDFEGQEDDLRRQLREHYRALLMAYREGLDRFFLQHFYTHLDPQTKEPTWDPVEAMRLGTIDEFRDSFTDLIDAASVERDAMLDEELAEGYEESEEYTLWLLYLGGIDSRDAPPPAEFSAIKAALLAAGIAGFGYPARLRVWDEEVKGRFAQQLRASIVGGRTGRDTLDTFDAMTNTYVGRVEGLAQNELHRAWTVGGAAATAPYQSKLVGEVWLTQGDPAVCPICKAKELTITDAQPIRDSHPGCRCWKVPIPLDLHQQPIDFVAFLQQIGRR